MSDFGRLKEIIYWAKNYGGAGIPDKKAVEIYLEIEPDEKAKLLKLQLQAIAEGSVFEEALDIHIGQHRKNRHGTYDRWARLMLMWLHVPKN